jgi:hypothetical protein
MGKNLNLKSFGVNYQKEKIIITHTGRNLNDYLNSLSGRYGGKNPSSQLCDRSRW